MQFKKNIIRNICFLCIFMLIIYSCKKGIVFEEYKSIGAKLEWNRDSVFKFNYKVTDTVGKYNLLISIRNTRAYKYNNLFLIGSILSKKSNQINIDTLEYLVTDPLGKWLGDSSSDLVENLFIYKENYKFDRIGDYIISIEHAVRELGDYDGVKNLEGISDVGLEIIKIDDK